MCKLHILEVTIISGTYVEYEVIDIQGVDELSKRTFSILFCKNRTKLNVRCRTEDFTSELVVQEAPVLFRPLTVLHRKHA